MIAERREIAIALSRARSEARVGYVPTTTRRAAPLHRRARSPAHARRCGFDTSYAQAQLAAQIEAVEQVDAYAQTGGNADLRRFAEDTPAATPGRARARAVGSPGNRVRAARSLTACA